jgi:predicted dehydrogenase
MNAHAREISAPRPRLGFLGLGWIGKQRFEALSADEAEFAAFADADAALAAGIARQHGARAGTDLRALLDADLDGVVIATPSGLHEAQARAALGAGLAVFCQKPLATDGAGAARVIEAAAAADRLLGVDFSYREVEGMRALRERVRTGELGEIFSVELRFHNAYAPSARWCDDPALAGGGCLLDLGVHLLDLALWLQGFPQLEVEAARLFANGTDAPAGGIEDFAAATLRQANGAVVRLACSWRLHAGQPAEIEVSLYGTRGAARWSNVGGSFLDFEIWLQQRDRRELLARDTGGWQPRALQAWLAQLGRDRRYAAEAHHLLRGAVAIDAIYRRAGGEVRA